MEIYCWEMLLWWKAMGLREYFRLGDVHIWLLCLGILRATCTSGQGGCSCFSEDWDILIHFLKIYSIVGRWSPTPRAVLSQEISKITWGNTELIVLEETSKTLYSLITSVLWCLFQYHGLKLQLCQDPSGALTRSHSQLFLSTPLS